MPPALAVDRLHRVGLVVHDIERTTRRYAEIFGMDRWEVREIGPDALADAQVWGRRTPVPHLLVATATSEPPTGRGWDGTSDHTVPVTFELIQPIAGESIFMHFRFLRRAGISHLTLARMEPAEFELLREQTAAAGIPIAASFTDGQVRRHFLDTRAALGGYYVEVQVAEEVAQQRPHTVLDHSGSYVRPPGVGPLDIFGINHFGVVVNDVMETITRYGELLGQQEWTIRDWRTEPGSLECPHYRGEQVDHEYLTALAVPFRDFGFEIIQPTHGPSHYNREFRDLWGAGIHHLLLNVSPSLDHWTSTRRWLESLGIPLVMGGELGGGAGEFGYFDTTEALGGYVLETYVQKAPFDQPQAASTDYCVDLASLARDL